MVDILYEDNHVLVAEKPANMLSQSDITGDRDILTILKGYIKEKYNKPGNVYLGLVQRLDRPVGGLMVFARTSKAAGRLSEQMREHKMGREYLCVAKGHASDSFTLNDWLLKDESTNIVSVVSPNTPQCQKAILHGKLLKYANGKSLCKIKLETGRSHQIRVQMANANLPLWGDNRYGNGLPGQQIALYGYSLTFQHPVSKEIMTFTKYPQGDIWDDFLPVIQNITDDIDI